MSDDEIFTLADDAPAEHGRAPAVKFDGPPAPTEAQINPYRLTERELAFVYACVELDDRVEAAATLNKQDPHRLARTLWDKPRVRRMYELVARERSGAISVAPSDVINRLASIAEANVVDAFKINTRGKLIARQLHEMPPALLIAIKKIRIGKDGIEIELHDKLKAMEMLGRYQGLWQGALNHEPRKPVQNAPRTIAGTFEERLAQHGSAISTGLAGPPIDASTPEEGAG